MKERELVSQIPNQPNLPAPEQGKSAAQGPTGTACQCPMLFHQSRTWINMKDRAEIGGFFLWFISAATPRFQRSDCPQSQLKDYTNHLLMTPKWGFTDWEVTYRYPNAISTGERFGKPPKCMKWARFWCWKCQTHSCSRGLTTVCPWLWAW